MFLKGDASDFFLTAPKIKKTKASGSGYLKTFCRRPGTTCYTVRHNTARAGRLWCPNVSTADVWNLLGPGISEDGQTLANIKLTSRWDFRGLFLAMAVMATKTLASTFRIFHPTGFTNFSDFQLPSLWTELISWTKKTVPTHLMPNFMGFID